MGKIIDSGDRYVCARPVYNAPRTRARATNPLHVHVGPRVCVRSLAPLRVRSHVCARVCLHALRRRARVARIHARARDRWAGGRRYVGFDDDIDFPRAQSLPLLLTARPRATGFKSGFRSSSGGTPTRRCGLNGGNLSGSIRGRNFFSLSHSYCHPVGVARAYVYLMPERIPAAYKERLTKMETSNGRNVVKGVNSPGLNIAASIAKSPFINNSVLLLMLRPTFPFYDILAISLKYLK